MSRRTHVGQPFLMKVLIFCLILISLLGWLRLRQVILDWDLILSLQSMVPPLYLAIGGGVWGLASLSAALLLWFRWPGSGLFTRFVTIFLAAWYWMDRLLLAGPGTYQGNFWFSILATVLIMLFTFLILEFQPEAVLPVIEDEPVDEKKKIEEYIHWR